ncbi:Uncharacterised protein [Mycobacterium tuberculosis]|nr:Uncharacterised protein [Mycobacterium tuberculosis]
MASKSAWVTDPGRQTQNPERGRKLDAESHRVREVQQSSDPKPREGTETLMVGHGRARLSGSSDPKPREGTETPRGWRMRCARKCRQTQNPERGRKHFERELVHSPPFRSSDPKPREGTETSEIQAPRHDHNASSDPKPREGTETGSRQTGSRRSSPVVRPKTTRGDGNLNRPSRGVSAVPESSDPKPREGTETTTTGSPPRLLTGIQDEHDGGVDGEDVWS